MDHPDSENEDFDSGIRERHFYTYNEDAALIGVVSDNGKENERAEYLDNVTERNDHPYLS